MSALLGGGKVKLPVTPDELEFFAGEEPMTIVPNFELENEDKIISCIGGRYGPFYASMPVSLPIWVALTLYKKGKCRIIPPTWLSPAALDRTITQEQQDIAVFQPVPYYYMEIAHLLFADAPNGARPCFGDSFLEVRGKLQQLANIRRHKIEEGLKEVSSAVTVKLNNLSAYEANLIRLSFQGTLNHFFKLEQAENALGSYASASGA